MHLPFWTNYERRVRRLDLNWMNKEQWKNVSQHLCTMGFDFSKYLKWVQFLLGELWAKCTFGLCSVLEGFRRSTSSHWSLLIRWGFAKQWREYQKVTPDGYFTIYHTVNGVKYQLNLQKSFRETKSWHISHINKLHDNFIPCTFWATTWHMDTTHLALESGMCSTCWCFCSGSGIRYYYYSKLSFAVMRWERKRESKRGWVHIGWCTPQLWTNWGPEEQTS